MIIDKNDTMLFHQDNSPILSIYINNYNYELDNIHFYNDKGIIFSIHYFEDDRSFIFKNETRIRRKLNLDRKENFIIKSKNISTLRKPYDLYIYYKNVEFEDMGTEIINQYYYNERNVMYSFLYHKYKVNEYIHYECVKPLSGRKCRLESRIEKLIDELSPSYTHYQCIDDNLLDEILKKIKKLNNRIRKENERLILREKLNR